MSRVGLIGKNSIEYIETLLDIWNHGDCAVLLDWRIPLHTAIEMMQEADVQKCYIEKKHFDKVPDALMNRITFIAFGRKSNSAEYLPDEIYSRFHPNYSRSEAIILYSSGTTGRSKGIILSHFAIHTNADAIIDYMHPASEDCIYIAKTLSHSSTITGELMVALKTHMKLVIAPTIVPPRYILSNINKFGVSIICLNPILLSLFADEVQQGDYDISTIRKIYVSGAILNDKIYRKAHAAFKDVPIYNVYGLSEAGPRVTAQRADCCSLNSVGKPITGIQIAVINEKGCQASAGEHGVIHIDTPSKFIGYVSGQVKHPSLYKDWLNTGDIGYINENGELHVVGRIDDIIILEAHKIYPNEIETQILSCHFIKDCVVVKVEYIGGEFLTCLYTGEKKAEQEMRELLKKQLPIYEIPRRFIWCDEIPYTLNGKVSKSDVRAKIINAIEMEKDNDDR